MLLTTLVNGYRLSHLQNTSLDTRLIETHTRYIANTSGVCELILDGGINSEVPTVVQQGVSLSIEDTTGSTVRATLCVK